MTYEEYAKEGERTKEPDKSPDGGKPELGMENKGGLVKPHSPSSAENRNPTTGKVDVDGTIGDGGTAGEGALGYEKVEPHIHEYFKRHLPHMHHFHSHLAKSYEAFNPMATAGTAGAAPTAGPAAAPPAAPMAPKPPANPQAQVARMASEQEAIQYAAMRTELDAIKQELATERYEKTVARCEQQVTQLEAEGFPVKDRAKLVTRLAKLPEAERTTELSEYREMYAGARRPAALPGGMIRVQPPQQVGKTNGGVTIDTPGVAEVVAKIAADEHVDMSDLEAYEAVEERVCKEWGTKYRKMVSREMMTALGGQDIGKGE